MEPANTGAVESVLLTVVVPPPVVTVVLVPLVASSVASVVKMPSVHALDVPSR